MEVDQDEAGYDRASSHDPDELLNRTGGSVRGALERVVRPAAQVVVNQFRELEPDSV